MDVGELAIQKVLTEDSMDENPNVTRYEAKGMTHIVHE